METFFKKHFRKKNVSSGPRRSSVVALPASKARRRSVVGQASAMLVQRRRRSSAQLRGLSCLGSRRKPRLSARRRSSTTTPHLSPRFSVQKKRGSHVRTIDTHLLGPSVLLASLIQVCEEEERRQSSCAESSSPETPEEGLEESDQSEEAASSGSEGVILTAEQERKELQRELALCACHPMQNSTGLRPLLRGPRCLRRSSSHLLPAEFVHSKAAYGLQGRYRCLSQQRHSSDTSKPGVLFQPVRMRRAARRWKVPAGTRWLSATAHMFLGKDSVHSGCRTDFAEGCSAQMPYVISKRRDIYVVLCERWSLGKVASETKLT